MTSFPPLKQQMMGDCVNAQQSEEHFECLASNSTELIKKSCDIKSENICKTAVSEAGDNLSMMGEYSCFVEDFRTLSKDYYTLKLQSKDETIFETADQVRMTGEPEKDLLKLKVKARGKKIKEFDGKKLQHSHNMASYMMIFDYVNKQAVLMPIAGLFDLKEDYSRKKKYCRSAARAEREFKRQNEEKEERRDAACNRNQNDSLYLGDISSSEDSEEVDEMDVDDLTNFMPSPPKRIRAGFEVESLYDACVSVICNESLPRLEKCLDNVPEKIAEHLLKHLTPKKFSKLENKCQSDEIRDRIWEKHCSHFKNCVTYKDESYRDYFMRMVKYFQREHRNITQKLKKSFSEKKGLKENYRLTVSGERNDSFASEEEIYSSESSPQGCSYFND